MILEVSVDEVCTVHWALYPLYVVAPTMSTRGRKMRAPTAEQVKAGAGRGGEVAVARGAVVMRQAWQKVAITVAVPDRPETRGKVRSAVATVEQETHWAAFATTEDKWDSDDGGLLCGLWGEDVPRTSPGRLGPVSERAEVAFARASAATPGGLAPATDSPTDHGALPKRRSDLRTALSVEPRPGPRGASGELGSRQDSPRSSAGSSPRPAAPPTPQVVEQPDATAAAAGAEDVVWAVPAASRYDGEDHGPPPPRKAYVEGVSTRAAVERFEAAAVADLEGLREVYRRMDERLDAAARYLAADSGTAATAADHLVLLASLRATADALCKAAGERRARTLREQQAARSPFRRPADTRLAGDAAAVPAAADD